MGNNTTSLVRMNLLNDSTYTPYCGNLKCRTTPRTFFTGKQFSCPDCKWESQFDEEFIAIYVTKHSLGNKE